MTTITTNTTFDPVKTASTQLPVHQMHSLASNVGRFLLHFLEMQIPMGLGMIPWHLLVRQLRASPSYAAAFQRGSDLSILGHGLFMTIPMVAWMVLRRHGWRHSLEMAIAMLAPMAIVTLLCRLGLDVYLPWLANSSGLFMFIGMLLAMLYRRDHYTGKANHSYHGDDLGGEKACH